MHQYHKYKLYAYLHTKKPTNVTRRSIFKIVFCNLEIGFRNMDLATRNLRKVGYQDLARRLSQIHPSCKMCSMLAVMHIQNGGGIPPEVGFSFSKFQIFGAIVVPYASASLKNKASFSIRKNFNTLWFLSKP